jgi:hypothetical protein
MAALHLALNTSELGRLLLTDFAMLDNLITCRKSFEMGGVLQAFRLVVGRAQRIVEGTDAMPQFPPLSDFTPTPWGRWISVRCCS